eukprot:7561887-Ditylum_brightwellii.AAC.1
MTCGHFNILNAMRCSLLCGNNKKQWNNNKSERDDNSQDCSTYIISAVGGKSFVTCMTQRRKK